MNDAKKLLLNIIEDRFRRFQDSYSLVTTDFLDMTQGSDAAAFVRSHGKDGVFFYGGYEDAERRMIVFVPDYLGVEITEDRSFAVANPAADLFDAADDNSFAVPDANLFSAPGTGFFASQSANSFVSANDKSSAYEDVKIFNTKGATSFVSANSSAAALHAYFLANPDDSPISILDVKIREKGATLRHGDYLGSLLALGIKREKTGDIMVREDGAQIFVATEIAEYLAENYYTAGRVSIEAKVKPLSELIITAARTERVRVSVASVRLDNMVSAAFDVSRKTAVEAINRGIVFVDNIETKKPDYFLKGGEKLVLRGKGKAVYRGESGTSKKGKIYVNFDKYI